MKIDDKLQLWPFEVFSNGRFIRQPRENEFSNNHRPHTLGANGVISCWVKSNEFNKFIFSLFMFCD